MPKPVKKLVEQSTEKQGVNQELRPYKFHGLDVDVENLNGEEVVDCPWCGREGKFSIQAQTGLWKCFVCLETGNATTFIRKLWEDSPCPVKEIKEFCVERGYVSTKTAISWGLKKSFLTGDWIVPGYGVGQVINQVYRYIKFPDGKKLLPTPTLGHQLFGLGTFKQSREVTFICEGPWDGIALEEGLSVMGKHFPESSEISYANSNVIAVPGIGTFFATWGKLVEGKTVIVAYDSDHPRTHPKTNTPITPAGLEGVRRVVATLWSNPKKPENLRYIRWGPEGYHPDLPSGTDARDFLHGVLS